MDKLESVLENKTKILWDFEIQTDHPIQARKPDPVLDEKRKLSTRISPFEQSTE